MNGCLFFFGVFLLALLGSVFNFMRTFALVIKYSLSARNFSKWSMIHSDSEMCVSFWCDFCFVHFIRFGSHSCIPRYSTLRWELYVYLCRYNTIWIRLKWAYFGNDFLKVANFEINILCQSARQFRISNANIFSWRRRFSGNSKKEEIYSARSH